MVMNKQKVQNILALGVVGSFILVLLLALVANLFFDNINAWEQAQSYINILGTPSGIIIGWYFNKASTEDAMRKIEEHNLVMGVRK